MVFYDKILKLFYYYKLSEREDINQTAINIIQK
jgi:hypothetical protein